MEEQKINTLIRTTITLTLISLSQQALADEQSNIQQLEDMVVTASKSPKTPGNVTQKIDIIDNKEIDAIVLGNTNVSELLKYQPGISISVLSRNDANWGASGGLSQKYNTFMVDGLPVDAFIEPQSLPIRAFERIEVQRGPAAVLYPNYLSMDFAGNQSPLTGTTNLILREYVDQNLSEIDGYYGSDSTFGGRLYHQQAAGNIHFFFGVDYEQSDYTDYGTRNSWLNMIDDPEYEKNKIYMKATAFLNEEGDHKASIFLSRTDHTGDVGRPNRDFDHDYWTINGAYALPLGEAVTANLKVGYRGYNRTWEEDSYPASLALASENGVEQHIFPVDLSISYDHLNGALLTFGTDYQQVSYETFSEISSKVKGNDANADQVGVYVQEEIPLGDFLIRAGTRYSYTKHDISLLGGSTPGNDEQDWDKLLWSAGIKYNPTPIFSIYTNAGSSFVAPSLKSVGGTIALSDLGVAGKNGQLPNPDLEPETGLGYDLGADIYPTDSIKLGIRGFYNLVDDQIVTVVVSDDPSQSQDINAGETTSYGAELSIEQRVSSWLKWFANYTYTSTEIDNANDPDQDGADVPFVPEHMGNIGVDVSLPFDITGSLYLHMASSIYDSTSKSNRSKFDGYEELNLSIKKTLFDEPGYKIDGYIDLYNLTDNQYEMPWQFQNPGFSFICGIKTGF